MHETDSKAKDLRHWPATLIRQSVRVEFPRPLSGDFGAWSGSGCEPPPAGSLEPARRLDRVTIGFASTFPLDQGRAELEFSGLGWLMSAGAEPARGSGEGAGWCWETPWVTESRVRAGRVVLEAPRANPLAFEMVRPAAGQRLHSDAVRRLDGRRPARKKIAKVKSRSQVSFGLTWISFSRAAGDRGHGW